MQQHTHLRWAQKIRRSVLISSTPHWAHICPTEQSQPDLIDSLGWLGGNLQWHTEPRVRTEGYTGYFCFPTGFFVGCVELSPSLIKLGNGTPRPPTYVKYLTVFSL